MGDIAKQLLININESKMKNEKNNTGYYSTGNYSTGNWSISDYSTGHFSTIDYSGFGAFNKPCTVEEWDDAEKPAFIYFKTTE